MRIEVKGITKRFRRKRALNDISFTINGKKIIGLLGRNGAGKTTFMKMLAGHILPTEGTILVNGEAPFDNRNVTKKICFIMEGDNFHKDMIIKNIFKSYASFYPNWDDELAYRLLDEYRLDKNARIKTLSKGMVSAVGVIVGLASKAPITIFDEPYIGLDAAARKKFYDTLLEEYEKEERLIIFSTHLIDEVSLLFEEVIIIQEGELVVQENAELLRDNVSVVIGEEEKVKSFINGKKVIKKETLAGMMTAYVFAKREEAERAQLKADRIPIQELMIYLTEKGGV